MMSCEIVKDISALELHLLVRLRYLCPRVVELIKFYQQICPMAMSTKIICSRDGIG